MSLPGQLDPAKIDGGMVIEAFARLLLGRVGVRYIRLVPDPAAKDQRSAIIRQRPHDTSLLPARHSIIQGALLEEPFELPGPLR